MIEVNTGHCRCSEGTLRATLYQAILLMPRMFEEQYFTVRHNSLVGRSTD